MSTDLLELASVKLTRFLGGTASRAGRRRAGRCYQITEGSAYIEMTLYEAIDLARAILADNAPFSLEPPIVANTNGR